jgi:alkylation response protein AidB-like acyl-CoA dehydrogenase
MDAAVALKEADVVAAVARDNADTTESGHRLAPAVVNALDASGLRSWWLPTALGGDAGDPMTMVEIVIRIAQGDASAGWCAGIGIGANALAAVVEPEAARALFAGAPGGVGVFSPTGHLVDADGGYSLAGRWPFGSNCQQAQWGAMGFMRFAEGRPVMTDTGPVTGLAFLRRDQFEIDENWDMAGLRGTGSHDITADTTVDEAHVSDLFAPTWSDDALYRLRMFDLLGPSLGVVPLGIGRAALDAAMAHIEATGDLPQRGPKPPFGLDQLGQASFGLADSKLRMAKTFVLDQLAEAWECAVRGDTPSREVSARIAIGLHEGLTVATEAVNLAVQIIGTAAFREGSVVDRLRRDVQAVACHVLFHPANLAPLGRQAAGMHTVAWPFLPPDPA